MRTRAPLLDLNAAFEADLRGRDGGRGMRLLLELVARHSIWVEPRVARAVPVVFPKTARFVPGSGKMGRVVGGIRLWANQPAQEAIFAALGSSQDAWRGQVVCHVYPESPYDPRHFTRLSNLFIMPASLSAFTEWGPVLAAVERHAFDLHGYRGPAGRTPPPEVERLGWTRPPRLGAVEEARITEKLRHMRRTRPMFSTPGGEGGAGRGKEGGGEGAPALKRPGARRLDDEFWAACEAQPETMRAFAEWVAHHTRFAPVSAVEAVPNPFPKVRRMRRGRGERAGQVDDGVSLAGNEPARFALMAALGYSTEAVTGGVVDHLWPGAAYLPAHNAHLGGLVLVPEALSSFVDAAPVRALLERRAFERTGYRGPQGRTPPKSKWAPASWPELVIQTPAQEARSLRRLRAYLVTRPAFFTGRHYRRGRRGRPR